MKKSDLRNGMVAETRHKLRFLVIGDNLVGKDGHIKLKEYNDDMQWGNNHQPGYISLDNFDIMKVYPNMFVITDYKVAQQPLWERKEPPRLTNDEIAILRNIDKEYKWIARDKDGGLCIYKDQPVKQGNPAWGCRTSYADLSLFSNMFNFIQWTDSEPYVIVGLLYSRKL
jgi:hypothetical protein